MKKLQEITPILLIALLIISLSQRSSINTLNNTINNQNSHISSIQRQIQTMQGSVDNSLRNFEKENRWLTNSNHVIKSISEDGRTADVHISWQFNQLNKDEKVYLMLGTPQDSSQYIWEKVEADRVGDLQFEKTLTLSFKNDYRIEVVAEGATSSRGGELGYVSLRSRLANRFMVHGSIHANSNNQARLDIHYSEIHSIKIMGDTQVSDDTMSKFQTKSAIVEVYFNGQRIESYDLFEDSNNSRRTNYHDYKETIINLNKTIKKEGLNSGRIYAIVKIVDGLGEEYQFQIDR